MQRLLPYVRPTWMLWIGLSVMLVIAVGAAFSSLEVQRGHRRSLLIHDYLLAVDGVEVALLQMESAAEGLCHHRRRALPVAL